MARGPGGAVLLTRASREHIYVANQLLRAGALAAVFVEAPGGPRSVRKEWRRLRRRYGWGGLGERMLLRSWRLLIRQARRRDAALAQVLGSDSDVVIAPELVHEVTDLNGTTVVDRLSEMAPDLVLVYGTGIIRDPVLQTARIGALNLHTGISPHYRGSDCSFWPVHDARFDLLGATIHECTSAVDGGAIVSTDRAELRPEDDLETIFARCVAVGARRYPECVARVLDEGRIDGRVQQPGAGREFKAAMRGIRAEYRARRSLSRGALADFLDGERSER